MEHDFSQLSLTKETKDAFPYIDIPFHHKKLQFYFALVDIHAKQSTCFKRKTGCVIVRHDGSIATSGYNGTPTGKQHCSDYWLHQKEAEKFDTIEAYRQDRTFRKAHREWSKAHEIHAERNAIIFAGRNGVLLKGCYLFTHLSPCLQCAISTHLYGIKAVIYREIYDEEGLEYLKENQVPVFQWPAEKK